MRPLCFLGVTVGGLLIVALIWQIAQPFWNSESKFAIKVYTCIFTTFTASLKVILIFLFYVLFHYLLNFLLCLFLFYCVYEHVHFL